MFKTPSFNYEFIYHVVEINLEDQEVEKNEFPVKLAKNGWYLVERSSNSDKMLNIAIDKYGNSFIRSTLGIDFGDNYISVVRYNAEERYDYSGNYIEDVAIK